MLDITTSQKKRTEHLALPLPMPLGGKFYVLLPNHLLLRFDDHRIFCVLLLYSWGYDTSLNSESDWVKATILKRIENRELF
jgi:hypothetical protein